MKKNCESCSKGPRGTCRLGGPSQKREGRPPLPYGFLLPPHVFPFLFFLRSLFKGAKLKPLASPLQPLSLFVPSDCLLAGTFSKTNWPVASLNTKLDRLMTDFGHRRLWIFVGISPPRGRSWRSTRFRRS